MTDVFIYALYDPRDGTLRYVGKSKNLARRIKNHRNEKGERRKNRWFRLLISLGLEPKISVLEQVSEAAWQERECWWIKHFRENGCDLLNHTDGGEGLNGASAETRAKMSALMKKRWKEPAFRMQILTPERALRLSISHRGKKKTAEHVAKLLQNKPGWKHRDDAKAKIAVALVGNQYRLGIPHTEATKEILRQRMMGNQYTLGKKMPESQSQKISEFQKGRPKSEIQRMRMSVARKLWWERKRNVG
jgi:group I intron endonuclease